MIWSYSTVQIVSGSCSWLIRGELCVVLCLWDYLNWYLVPVISNQTNYSPLIFLIKAFSHTEPSITTESVLFSSPCCVNSKDIMCENPSRSAVFDILKPAHRIPTTIPQLHSQRSDFFFILMCDVNIN